MKIVFDDKFYESDYANDGASASGRMEAIMDVIRQESGFEIVQPVAAQKEDLLLAHSLQYLDTIKANPKLYDLAVLAAGAAIMAANIGVCGEPAFACLRPPGHHAYRDSAWGYCVFANMALSLLRLKQRHLIESAVVLDFDAHTGDGTKALLSDWKGCHILNPYAETREEYIKEIQDFANEIPSVDIVGVCAGFDSYEKDAGKKLATPDYYVIGDIMKRFSKRASRSRRFAILEGGYYQPDLGKNVLAFCHGFM